MIRFVCFQKKNNNNNSRGIVKGGLEREELVTRK